MCVSGCEVGNLPAIWLRLDRSLAVIAPLTRGPKSIALSNAAADDAFFLRGVGGCSGFFGGRGGRGGAAGWSFGTFARVDFCFHCRGFFLDDAEAAFDRVVGRTWHMSISRSEKEIEMSRGRVRG